RRRAGESTALPSEAPPVMREARSARSVLVHDRLLLLRMSRRNDSKVRSSTNGRRWRPARARRAALLSLVFGCFGMLNLIASSAEQVPVGRTEGLTHGFLVVRTLEGKTLADGELSQYAEGDVVKTHRVFHFRDGSLYEEEAS